MNMSLEQQDTVEKLSSASHSPYLRRWLPLVLQNARGIIRFVCVVTAAALVLSFILPVRYQSEARLLPSNSDAGGGKLLKMLGGMADAAIMAGYTGTDAGGGADIGRFIGILHSRTVADHIIDQFGLMKVYGTSKRENARIGLQQHTTITEERKTGEIVLNVTDNDPKRAADIVQAYINELNTLNAKLDSTAAHVEREFLEQRIKEVGTELNTAAEQLSEFSQKNTMIGLGEQQKSMLEGAARVQGELIAARTELSGLEQLYSDNNYRVREARARANRITQELQNLRGSDSGDAKDAMFPSIRELPELGKNYAELYKKTKTLEMTSEMLSRQLEMVKTEEVKELPVIRVLDPPEVAQSKTWPPRKMITACALLLSFVVAVSWVIGRQVWTELSSDHEAKVVIATICAWWSEWRWRTPGTCAS
jgi:uncharacterized protein involved in exopolysaccharide biosynthesis